MHLKRAIGLVVVFCFVLTFCLSMPVFAASADESGKSSQQALKTVAAVNTVKDAETAEKTANTTGSGLKLAQVTTGDAIELIVSANETLLDMAASINGSKAPINYIIGQAFNLTSIAGGLSGFAAPADKDLENLAVPGAKGVQNPPGPASEDGKNPTTPAASTADDKNNMTSRSDENLWYSSKIPMKKDHQYLLWTYCQKRNLDYIDMLALISLESNFYEKCSSGKYKGYFQISSSHGPNLSKTLNTPNKPLDGSININWGTAMYSWILADKRVKGLTGKKKRDVALSIYQRGTGGYDKYGLSKSFLAKFYKKRDIVVSYFK